MILFSSSKSKGKELYHSSLVNYHLLQLLWSFVFFFFSPFRTRVSTVTSMLSVIFLLVLFNQYLLSYYNVNCYALSKYPRSFTDKVVR